MYEKNGLMSKITNAEVLEYLRSIPDKTNVELVEDALCEKLGLPPKIKRHCDSSGVVKIPGKKKIPDCRNGFPVKVSDQRLIDHIISQKRNYGILYRHTIESAIINMARRQKHV